jgi:hypothetical protein
MSGNRDFRIGLSLPRADGPRLHIQPNRPHQRQPIALRDDSCSQLVIEAHSSVFELQWEVQHFLPPRMPVPELQRC